MKLHIWRRGWQKASEVNYLECFEILYGCEMHFDVSQQRGL